MGVLQSGALTTIPGIGDCLTLLRLTALPATRTRRTPGASRRLPLLPSRGNRLRIPLGLRILVFAPCVRALGMVAMPTASNPGLTTTFVSPPSMTPFLPSSGDAPPVRRALPPPLAPAALSGLPSRPSPAWSRRSNACSGPARKPGVGGRGIVTRPLPGPGTRDAWSTARFTLLSPVLSPLRWAWVRVRARVGQAPRLAR